MKELLLIKAVVDLVHQQNGDSITIVLVEEGEAEVGEGVSQDVEEAQYR